MNKNKKIIISISVLFLIIISIIVSLSTSKNNISEAIVQSTKSIDNEYKKNKLMVEMAIEAFKASHNNKLPQSESDIVPIYLKEMPLNPKTNKKFKLEKFLKVSKNNKGQEKEKSLEESEQPKARLVPQKIHENKNGSFVIEEEPFKYVSIGKRDPFMLIDARKKNKDLKKIVRKNTPLEEYSLNDLQLKGVIFMGDDSKAMVEDKNQKGFVLNLGTRIGKYGVVDKINKDSVIIKETRVDFTNKETISFKKISLRKTK